MSLQLPDANGVQAPTVTRLNLYQLLTGDRAFKIPTYQREYAWGEEQIEALCEDLTEFHSSSDGYYLLGQLILAKNSEPDASQYPLAVVDGQQRLTSLFLLFIGLRNGLESRGAIAGNGSDAGRILQAIVGALEVLDPYSGYANLRLRLSDLGADYLLKLFTKAPLPEIDYVLTQQNIRDNSTFIANYLDKNFAELDALAEFTTKVLYKVFVIETLLEGEEQALDIFEKLNSRGMPLNSADLLKNLLFQQANMNSYNALSKTWTSAVENVYKVRPHKAASMEYVMKAMLGARTGAGTGKKGVYKAWRDRFKTGISSLEDFATELEKDAKHLSSVTSAKLTAQNSRLVGCRYFGTVQHLPLVVAGRKFSKNEEAHKLFTSLIEARIMTYLFSEEKTQIFEAMVWPWAKNIHDLGSEPSPKEILEASSGAFANQSQLFDQARLHFSGYSYLSARDQKRIRFVLASASNALEISAGNSTQSNTAEEYLAKQKGHSGFHLDHIYPKSAIIAKSLGDSSPASHAWIHSPGNLVLLHAQDNMSAGAASAELKSKDYASSKLLLTNSLALPEHLVSLNKRLRDAVEVTRDLGNPDVANWSAEKAELRTAYLWQAFENSLNFENFKG